MRTLSLRRALAVAGAAAMLSSIAGPVRAQDSKSAALVKELTQLLDAKKLDAIAAPDPANLGTYVAALYFPGSQLLVVLAKYAATQLLNEQIAKRDYRKGDLDLRCSASAGSKLL